MLTELTIPAGPEALDADWLTEALRRSGAADGRVVDFTVEPVGVGIGLVGALCRIRPRYADGTGPASIIAKFPAPDEGSRFVAAVLGMYRKEVGFYVDLSARTALPHAACYHAAHDPATDGFVLLLSDLAAGRTVDQIAGCERAEAELAVDRLADFHAGFWDDPTLADVDWLGALADAPFPDAIALSYGQSWAPVQELFGDLLTPEVRAFGDRFVEVLPDLVGRLSEPPCTLRHGDYRLDNIFFVGGDLTVCDWQLVDRSRGARDLAYFLSQSLTPELRATLDRPLVERYVDRLTARGVTGYPIGQAWDDYRLATAFAFVYPVVAGGSLDHADERATSLCREMFRRSVAAITELDALAVL